MPAGGRPYPKGKVTKQRITVASTPGSRRKGQSNALKVKKIVGREGRGKKGMA